MKPNLSVFFLLFVLLASYLRTFIKFMKIFPYVLWFLLMFRSLIH